MEFPEEDVIDVFLTETEIKIIYQNGGNEILTKDKDGYKIMFDGWLKEQPMFISDIFKTQMRDLSFGSRNNQTSVNNLNNFFKEENKTEVIKFLNYMRKRDLTFEKQKWIKIKELSNNSEENVIGI
jgi:acyl CoA:acetate/3-ketoacid CoA transferase alpha subunit